MPQLCTLALATPLPLDTVTNTAEARSNKTAIGNAAEEIALQMLLKAGLGLVARQYKTPGRGGGEIDLIVQEHTGEHTLVFVEVRHRSCLVHGSGAESVRALKQRRVVYAARHYLLRLGEMGKTTPPCRFDVIDVSGDLASAPVIEWIKGAFTA